MSSKYGTMSQESTNAYEASMVKKRQSSGWVVNLPEHLTTFKLPKETPFIKLDIIPMLTETSNGKQLISRYNYFVHKNIGPDYSAYICPNKMGKGACPICSYVNTLNWKDEEQYKLVQKYRPQQRQLYAVVWVDDPTGNKDVRILDISAFGFGKLIDEALKNRDMEDEANWDKFADIEEGMTLRLGLADATFNGNEFVKVTRVDFKPRAEGTVYTDSHIEAIGDPASWFNYLDEEELAKRWSTELKAEADNEEVAVHTPAKFDMMSGNNPIVDTPATDSSSEVTDEMIPF